MRPTHRSAALPLAQTRIIAATRAEQIRVKADTRDGLPTVRLDLLEPIAKHSSALSVIGRAMLVPVASVDALIQALYAAKLEAGEPAAPPASEEGF